MTLSGPSPSETRVESVCELVIDEIVPGESLRDELTKRYELYNARNVPGTTRKKHAV